MDYRHDDTTALRRSVFQHGFCDPTDWAHALDALADCSDDELDAIVASKAEDETRG